MGQACCTYGPKDTNNQDFGSKKTIEKQANAKLYLLPAEQAAKLMAKAKAHELQVIKMQALARGFLIRLKYDKTGKKRSARKGRRSGKQGHYSELEQKMLSARSG